MNILDVSKDTALRELSKLVLKNIIKREGIGRGIYYILKYLLRDDPIYI